MKYLTVVTNFEGADIGIPPTTLSSLDMLKAAVQFEKARGVSVVGGGEPLYEYKNHKKYYQRLFRACREMKLPVEIHTTIVDSEFPYEKCAYLVYHLRNFDQLEKITRHGTELVRVAFVVDKGCTLDLVDKIADFCENSEHIDSLCFRIGVDKAAHPQKCCLEYIRNGFGKRWIYVEGSLDSPPYFINGEIRYSRSDISG